MADPLLSLAPSDLRALSTAIRTGRLSPPYSSDSLERYLHAETASHVASSLQTMQSTFGTSTAIAHSLELLSEALSERALLSNSFDLVTSSPEVNGITNRDTCVVVSELFRNARNSVLLAGYAVHQGQTVFRALAARMQAEPTLAVRLFLDIQRRPGDTTADPELVRRFIHQFRTSQWPVGTRMPEIFYYPASLNDDRRACSALHAKCIVVDNESVYISSANFTEAAQQRNIEVGILVRSADLAERATRFFNALVVAGELTSAIPFAATAP